MTSRIEIINDGLLFSGNNQVDVEFDGSDEWEVGYRAYSRAVKVVLEKGKFNFSTESAPLARLGDAPAGFDRYTSAYAMPAGCLMLTDVRLNGIGQHYVIHDNQIITRVDDLIGLYVREPSSSAWPHLFVEAVTLYVEAGCWRGLNHDQDEAAKREKRADEMFETAHTRTDQQAPPRAMFASRIRARRRGGGYPRGG